MGKNEVIVEVAKAMSVSQKDVRDIVDAFIDGMTASITAMKPEEKFFIPGLGTWHMSESKPRVGRNPKTGEEMPIPAGRRISFKAAKGMKDVVKGK